MRLTDILRSYIEARYNIKAMERTTDELLATSKAHPELCVHAARIYSVLATADMAKFARAQPLPTEHVGALQTTRDFITASIPVPQPLPQPNPTAQP